MQKASAYIFDTFRVRYAAGYLMDPDCRVQKGTKILLIFSSGEP